MDKKKKCNLNLNGKVISLVLFIALIASFLTGGFGIKSKLFSPSEQKIGENTLSFVNNNLLQPGTSASLSKASCNSGVDLCNVQFNVQGQKIDSYVSSDGKIFFPEAINIEDFKASLKSNQSQTQEEVPTSDKPSVNLFIMSYCPYGLQAQKAMLPSLDLLKQEAEIDVNFVNYAMHDKEELDENLLQYCLQSQNRSEYIKYLNCFVEKGDSSTCLGDLDFNKSKLNSCIDETDKEYEITKNYNNKDTWINGSYPKFSVEDDLNQKYQVAGSPTLVINGVQVSPNRTPEAYKNAICQAFNNPPKDCEKTLSQNTPVASFGTETTNQNTDASCN
ncbi:MAG TPA: hypothetical protein VJ900_02640 [Patescibacteria group bacterium]|nr:hypothetical protein [Patescibacteria group bacterium]